MTPDLAPKYIQSIGQSVILWFEYSNSYVVISKTTNTVLSFFLESNSVDQFEKKLAANNFSEQNKSEDLYKELSTFLNKFNSPHLEPSPNRLEYLEIPKSKIKRFYSFGNRTVQLNFGSKIIEKLFHPQLTHCLSENHQTDITIFDILTVDKTLYLFRNQEFIYSSTTKDYHLLQGRFALELTNEIHKKNTNNWLSTFHASTICNTNEAVMLIGDSGNGKSTLSAILMANGFDLLSDDFTPLYYDDMCLYRYPAAISIKKGAFKIIDNEIETFSSLPTYFNGPKNINIKYVPPRSEFSHSIKSLPCRRIVHVKYSKNCQSSFKKVSEEKILQILIPDAWISPKPEHAKRFLSWLSEVEFFELHYSENDYAIRSLNKLMSN